MPVHAKRLVSLDLAVGCNIYG